MKTESKIIYNNNQKKNLRSKDPNNKKGSDSLDNETNDIDDLEKIASNFTLQQTISQNEKDKKKKYQKKTNKFFDNNFSSQDQRKLTRDEQKIANYQRMFERMEEVSVFLQENYIFFSYCTMYNDIFTPLSIVY